MQSSTKRCPETVSDGHMIHTWTLTQGLANSNPDADSVVILQRTSSIPSETGVKHHSGSNYHSLDSGEFYYFLWVLSTDSGLPMKQFNLTISNHPEEDRWGNSMNYLCQHVHTLWPNSSTARSASPVSPALAFMIPLRLFNFNPQLHHSLVCLSFFHSKMGTAMLFPTPVTFLGMDSYQGRLFPSHGSHGEMQ